jgi:sugar O-acyltransferase (sialic acid O-acetyltransferase NeuD family)
MDNSVYGLVGSGGFAREVLPLVRSQAADSNIFLLETQPTCTSVNGTPVISIAEFFNSTGRQKFFNFVVADTHTRRRLVDECLSFGGSAFSVRCPTLLAYDRNQIGEGAIFCAHNVVTSNVKIGKYFHGNLRCYIAHDCVIGDYVTFAPGVMFNGNVRIGNHVYVGAGAVIKNGSAHAPLLIGEGAVIGMGAVVTRNVAPHSTVVGNPARPLNQRRIEFS